CATSIIRRLQHLGTISLLSHSFRAIEAVKGHPARCNVDEQELPNAPEVPPQREVTNIEFYEAIWMLSQAVSH
ncbi:hypothetical protein H5410_036533, partial [Solanum commersonii]